MARGRSHIEISRKGKIQANDCKKSSEISVPAEVVIRKFLILREKFLRKGGISDHFGSVRHWESAYNGLVCHGLWTIAINIITMPSIA